MRRMNNWMVVLIGVAVAMLVIGAVLVLKVLAVGWIAARVALCGGFCALFGGLARWYRQPLADWWCRTVEHGRTVTGRYQNWPNVADQIVGMVQFLSWYFGSCTLWYLMRGIAEVAFGVISLNVRMPWYPFSTMALVGALFHTAHVLHSRTIGIPRGRRVELRGAHLRAAAAYNSAVFAVVLCGCFIVARGVAAKHDINDALAVQASEPYQAALRIAQTKDKTKVADEDKAIALDPQDVAAVDKVLANRRPHAGEKSDVRKIREKVTQTQAQPAATPQPAPSIPNPAVGGLMVDPGPGQPVGVDPNGAVQLSPAEAPTATSGSNGE